MPGQPSSRNDDARYRQFCPSDAGEFIPVFIWHPERPNMA
jgi:hypothetical protein